MDTEVMVNELAGWDLSVNAFLAVQSNSNRQCTHPTIAGAYVRILNSVSLSMGTMQNVYGMITSPPKPGGMYYKVSVFDRSLQCFKEVCLCRD